MTGATTKEIFKPVACTTPLNPCTFCGWPAELFSRSNADGTFSEKAVMCSNFGDDDPTGNACPLHLPPEDFYHATKREAIEYWNERTARGKERITAALTAEVAELRRDAERLDFLDGNKRFKTGWEVGVAPVGLISVRGIGLGTKSIREAIDAARLGEQP